MKNFEAVHYQLSLRSQGKIRNPQKIDYMFASKVRNKQKI